MKKFFALMLTVAMLLVAGSAMAADPTVTASETSFTLKAGGASKTITVNVAAANGGTLTPLKASGVSWAEVTDNGSGSYSVKFEPTASVNAGTYIVNLGVTENYVEGTGAVGHGSIAKTASGRAVLQVSVLSATQAAGTAVVTKIVETVTTVTRTVTIISAAARESAVVETFEEVTRSVADTITTTVLEQVKGFVKALVDVWTAPAKVRAVEEKKNAVTSTLTSSAGRSNVFKYSKVPAGATEESFKPKDNNLLQPATSSVSSDATVEQKLAAATSALGDSSKKALSAGDAVKPTESGTFTFSKTFGSDLYGTKIGGSRNKQRRTAVTGSFYAAAAADDEEGVAFVNSSGDIVDTIPGNENSQDIMPGFVNMLVVMEANEVYEPVIFATTAALASNNIAIDTRSVDVVVVDEVKVEETKAVITINADGTVGKETIVEKADPTVEDAVKAAMGTDSISMVPADRYGAEISADVVSAEKTAAASADLHVAAKVGRSFNELGTGAYYFKISFDALPSGRSLESGATFTFYPDGIVEGSTATAKFFDDKGAEVTPSSLLGKTGIVAFQIDSNGIVHTADFDNTLADPTVAIKMNPKGSVESPDVVLEDLRKKGYVSGTTINEAGFKSGYMVLTEGTVTAAVELNFTVDPDSWTVSIQGETDDTITPSSSSAMGSITDNTATSAFITLVPSEIHVGTRDVTLEVRPVSGDTSAKVSVSAVIGTVLGTKQGVAPGDVGVGSSSSGCSAGSAVLALAVLGAFIATRKK